MQRVEPSLLNEIQELRELIHQYQLDVRRVVDEFEMIYGRRDLLAGWGQKAFPSSGKLNEVVVSYRFHGVGLWANLNGKEVDFDFAPNDDHNGFDAWRLMLYAESMGLQEQWPKERITRLLANMESSAMIHRKYSRSSLYFWSFD